MCIRNLSSEFVANVTETSVVVSVDGLGQYNASVRSWTRLGDGGMLIYITFSTIESGKYEHILLDNISNHYKHVSNGNIR